MTMPAPPLFDDLEAPKDPALRDALIALEDALADSATVTGVRLAAFAHAHELQTDLQRRTFTVAVYELADSITHATEQKRRRRLPCRRAS